jgi:hypothetical protein
MTVIPALIQITRGTYAEFQARDFVYPAGVQTYITAGSHAGRMKIGDGVTSWNSLPFLVPQATELLLGLIKSSTTHLYGYVNANGSLSINGLETDLTAINGKNSEQDTEIAAIKQQLAGMSGTVIYIGGIDKYTGELTGMDAADRNALLTARAVALRGQVMDGYTLQDLGVAGEMGRFHYWQYQPDGTWFDLGERGEVSQATDTDLGIVMGSGAEYKIHIEPDGTMSVNGLSAKLSALDDKDNELAENIAEVGWALEAFEAAQAQTNEAVAGEIEDIKENAETLKTDLQTFQTAQEENNAEQDEGITEAAAAAATALLAAQSRIAKAIFDDTHAALVADMALGPKEGALANILKTLKNVDNGQKLDMNVAVKSESGSLESFFSQIDANNYELNLEAVKFKPLSNGAAVYATGNGVDGGYLAARVYYEDEKTHLKSESALTFHAAYPQFYYKSYAYVCADIAERDALAGVEHALCVDGGADGADALYRRDNGAWVFVENRAGHDEENSRVARYIQEIRGDGPYVSRVLQGYAWQKAVDREYVDGAIAAAVVTTLEDREASPALPSTSPSGFAGLLQQTRDNLKYLRDFGGGGGGRAEMEEALPPFFADRDGRLVSARGGTLIELNVTEQPEQQINEE